MINEILSVLPGDHPWQNTLICYDCVSSTNDLAKELAKNGAPEGTVLVAAEQTAGRGRMGRSFHAPAGQGLYFSLILRPNCPAQELLHLTCAAGVAACDAVEDCCGQRPQIKWTNDLVMGTRKLGGILTELSVNSKAVAEWAVIGIGINCLQKEFPAEIQSIATSILLHTDISCSPSLLAGHLIMRLYTLCQNLISGKRNIMATYRQDCMTVSRQVVLLRGDEKRYGTALDVDEDGGLVVRFADNTVETVQSGEISVRGLYGYI